MTSFFNMLFGKQDTKAPKTAMPTPEVPAVPEKEEPGDVMAMMKKRKGRAQTVLTGELEPTDIGKKTLLG